tara:strand:- start:179 stop:496 length:318 start_codon:yes stop_codon:yes gene_type:complete
MERIQHNKLVRDKIPQRIEQSGKSSKHTAITGHDLELALVAKLAEEGQEFLESREPEELADLLEVVHGLIEARGVEYDLVEQFRIEKKEQRGGFSKGIFLEYVDQ